jgi:hypothetical protein
MINEGLKPSAVVWFDMLGGILFATVVAHTVNDV